MSCCASLVAAEYRSPLELALTNQGQSLWIAQDTACRIELFDTARSEIVRAIDLPERPRGIVCQADGRVGYVVIGEGEGRLLALDLGSGELLWELGLGNGPTSPVLSADERTLYVCDRFDDTVSWVDLQARKVIQTVEVVREPIACVLSADEEQLLVANHLPDGPANVDYVAAQVSVVDTAKGVVLKHIKLVNGSEGLRAIALSPDGKYAYVTHIMARFQIPTTQLERGWVCTNALSVVDVADQQLLYTVLLDDVNRGFANPWGVTVSADNQLLCVSSAGNHELSLIDLPALTAKIEASLATREDSTDTIYLDAHNNLSMLVDVRQRVPLQGLGPRAVVMQGAHIYVAEYFSDSLGRVTLSDTNALADVLSVESIPLGSDLPLSQERHGELLFNDARACFQNWLSCASCHPDARTDGLNWDLLLDGMGNPKNVKSMLDAHETAPTTWLGIRENAEVSVRSGFKHIQFVVRPESDAQAIDAYLRSLTPTPSPELVHGKLSESAQRGEVLFDQVGCVDCHSGPLYTDQEQYKVGTGTGRDAGKAFDVPALREVWRTAPYLHDGRIATLREIIRTNSHAKMSKRTAELDEQQLDDLEAFLRSL